jgi:hypothetical protein
MSDSNSIFHTLMCDHKISQCGLGSSTYGFFIMHMPCRSFPWFKKKMGRRCEKRQGERPEQSTQQIWAHSGAPRLSSLPPSGTPSLLNDFQKPKQEGMGLNSQIINKTQAGSGGLKLIPKLHVSAELPLSEEETRSDLIIN